MSSYFSIEPDTSSDYGKSDAQLDLKKQKQAGMSLFAQIQTAATGMDLPDAMVDSDEESDEAPDYEDSSSDMSIEAISKSIKHLQPKAGNPMVPSGDMAPVRSIKNNDVMSCFTAFAAKEPKTLEGDSLVFQEEIKQESEANDDMDAIRRKSRSLREDFLANFEDQLELESSK